MENPAGTGYYVKKSTVILPKGDAYDIEYDRSPLTDKAPGQKGASLNSRITFFDIFDLSVLTNRF